MGYWKDTHYHIELDREFNFEELESAIRKAMEQCGYAFSESEAPSAESALLRAAGEGSITNGSIKGEKVDVIATRIVPRHPDGSEDTQGDAGVRETVEVTLTAPLSRLERSSEIVLTALVDDEVGVYVAEELVSAESVKRFPFVQSDLEAVERAIKSAL